MVEFISIPKMVIHRGGKIHGIISAEVSDGLTNIGHRDTGDRTPQSTRTAKEAAAAIGCEIAQIAKSLIFRRLTQISQYW